MDCSGTDESFWAEARAVVEESWASVFEVVNQLLKNHDQFGFELIQKKSSPRLEDMHMSLQFIKELLNGVSNFPGIEYSLSRMALNAKQQIHRVERLITSLEHQSKEEYLAIIGDLARQAQF